MARVLWLADVLRDADLTVVEHSGWKTRGFQPWEPRFGIVHATAAPRSQSDATQVAIVRDGHSTLQGPIANCVVDRSGRWHVVASGRCNTALTGWDGPASGLGNTHLLGVEACNDNRSEPWPDVQYDAYVAGWAAICAEMGWAAGRCVGHKEHQPGNKSDPTFDMGTFRHRVAAALGGEEDDMDQGDIVRHTDKNVAFHLRNALRYAEQGSWGWTLRDHRRDEDASAGSLLAWAHYTSGETLGIARRLATGQEAILAHVAGRNVAESVEQLLAQHAERERAERGAELAELRNGLAGALLAELGPALVDALGEAAGELPADAVEAAVGRALARTSLTVEPAVEEPV